MSDIHVGIVGGTRLPGNVRTFLENVRRLLTDVDRDLTFDLVVRKGHGDALSGYTTVDPGLAETNRAIETIRSLTHGMTAYAKERNPDLLWQVTKFPIHGFAAVVAGHRTDVPVLTRFAGDNFREYKLANSTVERLKTYCLNNTFGRVTAAAADATIVLGPNGRDEIKCRGGGRLYEIPQPVNRDRFHLSDRAQSAIREDLGLPTEDLVLLSVGRVSRRKGMDDLAVAAKELAQQDVDLTWCVVGEGPYRPRVNSLPVVHAEGRVPHEDIPRYYQAADLVVHPSKIEGLPNVLLEAAACGTPTLARDVGDSATVASATFNDSGRLPSLVRASYEPVDLNAEFSAHRLRADYEQALVETARA